LLEGCYYFQVLPIPFNHNEFSPMTTTNPEFGSIPVLNVSLPVAGAERFIQAEVHALEAADLPVIERLLEEAKSHVPEDTRDHFAPQERTSVVPNREGVLHANHEQNIFIGGLKKLLVAINDPEGLANALILLIKNEDGTTHFGGLLAGSLPRDPHPETGIVSRTPLKTHQADDRAAESTSINYLAVSLPQEVKLAGTSLIATFEKTLNKLFTRLDLTASQPFYAADTTKFYQNLGFKPVPEEGDWPHLTGGLAYSAERADLKTEVDKRLATVDHEWLTKQHSVDLEALNVKVPVYKVQSQVLPETNGQPFNWDKRGASQDEWKRLLTTQSQQPDEALLQIATP
jgi:hypothetical protein